MSLADRLHKLTARENLPRSRLLRTLLGGALVFFGLLGFLPVLGFWMVPLGLAVLAVDFPIARLAMRRLVHIWEYCLQKWRNWRKEPSS